MESATGTMNAPACWGAGDGAPWTIGRNAEFPGQRIFEGYVDRPKVFFGALDAEAILGIFHSESKSASSTP